MATSGADGVFRAVYEGCISGYDNCVQRRPYHRNCGCALHNNNNRKHCSHMLQRCDKVSYRMRRAWSEGNLVMATPPSSSSSSSSPSSNHSSPVAAAASGDMPRLSLFKEEEEEE